MKYKDFYAYLSYKVNNLADIGPHISIKLGITPTISISNKKINNNHNFLIFPIKIYGENIHHLNILLLDREKKVIERYEPFNEYLNFEQINELLESLLHKLREDRKIYFLMFQSTLNQTKILNDKNCGMYCIQYAVKRVKRRSIQEVYNCYLKESINKNGKL